MWQDDEDNNPYGSFEPGTANPTLDSSCELSEHTPSLSLPRGTNGSEDHDQQSISPPTHSPENEPPEFLSHPHQVSDDEDADPSTDQKQAYLQKKGTYDSRIQQLLYENPELEIIIADAGKSSDGGFIVYRIRTGVHLPSPSIAFWLIENRTSRCLGGIPSSAPSEQHWSTYIQLLSFPRYLKSTPWRIMRQNRGRLKKIQVL